MSEAKLKRLIELYGLDYEEAGVTIDDYQRLSGLRKDSLYPNPEIPSLCYVKNCIKNPNIIVGDYTYYDDKKGADLFEKHVTHLYDWNGDKLIIGKFCQIGSGVEFIMNGANHQMAAFTTYPFYIFSKELRKHTPQKEKMPLKGDTVIGNDVWIGQNVTILPGVHIGSGAIIGANSVVGSDVPPYSIAVGNPCHVIKDRFDLETKALLLEIAWWNWEIEKIQENIDVLLSLDVEKLKRLK
ncbi:MAG: CatB-related O-acetyltransferase [Bacilli bacterium]|nr:CatB-related O-acetyltransferase [Bacilli bacterium]